MQEGDEPSESPTTLLGEVDRVSADMTRLIRQINRTNAVVQLDEGRTIADAIADRDGLRTRHSILTSLVHAAVIKQDRYLKSEVRYQTTIDIIALQQQIDDLARADRELDTRIQAANWSVDLID